MRTVDNRPMLVIEFPGKRYAAHALPPDPEIVCMVVRRLAEVMPRDGIWYVVQPEAALGAG